MELNLNRFKTITRKQWLVGGAAVALLAAGGVAVAQTAHPMRDHRGGMMRNADTNNDGNITRAELQASVATHFAQMDVNKDGRLTPEDRAAAMEARAAEHFAEMDANKDGSVTRAEFDAARTARMAQRQQMRDDDDRGPGGPEGGPRMRGDHHGRGPGGHHGDRGPGGRGDMGRMADANKDGAVTQAEMLAAATAHFDRIDTNKDGTITAAEKQAAFGQWRAKRAAAAAPAPATK